MAPAFGGPELGVALDRRADAPVGGERLAIDGVLKPPDVGEIGDGSDLEIDGRARPAGPAAREQPREHPVRVRPDVALVGGFFVTHRPHFLLEGGRGRQDNRLDPVIESRARFLFHPPGKLGGEGVSGQEIGDELADQMLGLRLRGPLEGLQRAGGLQCHR
jgi:hypothetical protein